MFCASFYRSKQHEAGSILICGGGGWMFELSNPKQHCNVMFSFVAVGIIFNVFGKHYLFLSVVMRFYT